ncbi:MAG TPA: bifunctional nuclease family protein [Euzebyales bacterium]|jgi:bifunctional DNase/RNase|nr:bifunctional nuclease family protein [Euzebyales bacterium]
MLIELELVGVRVELPHNQPIVLLKEQTGFRFLPIWIGAPEATSIAFALQGVAMPRPLTHDLLRNVLADLSVDVERIVVTELRDGTFYAEIELVQGGRTVKVSSRPSDAIALAVRASVPIFAEEAVLAEAGIEIEDEDEQEVERFKQFIDSISPEDFRT